MKILGSSRSSFTAGLAVLLAAGAAMGQGQIGERQAVEQALPPHYRVDTGPQASTLYATGEQILVPTEQVWRFACGSDTTGKTAEDLRAIAEANEAMFEDPADVVVVDNSGGARGGFNMVFNISNPPAGATGAFAIAESFLENTFSDPITVTVTVGFQNMGSGVLGATGSSYASTTYNNSRNGLQNGMDSNDAIQDWLPAGSTVPVRYVANNATVTNEGTVFWTRANYRATIGSITGTAASMTYNTQFNWDWDPSNGISGSSYSFVDVIIHEVGHSLGFTSGSDFRTNDMEALDLFRFARLDGTGDWNPDNNLEFQTTARVVDLFNNDDVNSDIVVAEHRMSDGSPYQTSHFREQGNPNIGLMDPALAPGQTFYSRGYFSTADLDMFDAIGWDHGGGSVCTITITTQPQAQTVCPFQPFSLIVLANGTGTLEYQWRKNGANIPGATSNVLDNFGALPDDGGSYDCVISNGCTTENSNAVNVVVRQPAAVSQHPQSQTVDEGDGVTFTVTGAGTAPLSYQWRKDNAEIGGATSSSYSIASVTPDDAGEYTCTVTNACNSATSNAAVLTVDQTSECPADFNENGSLDVGDFTAFRNAYLAGDLSADFSGNGTLEVADFTAFRNAYLAGCP